MRLNREEQLKKKIVRKLTSAIEVGATGGPKDEDGDPIDLESMNVVGVISVIEQLFTAGGFKPNLKANWDGIKKTDPERRLQRLWSSKDGEIEVSAHGPSVIIVQGESIIKLLDVLMKKAKKPVGAGKQDA